MFGFVGILAAIGLACGGAQSELLGTETSTLTSGNGLTGSYFDQDDFTVPRLVRVDEAVNFNWGSGSPDPSIGPDTFSVRWTGFVVPRFTESYTVTVKSDDGARLWVDGKLIVDRWYQHAAREYSGTVSLTAGRFHELRLEYFEASGGAVAQLLWSSPQQAKEVIPRAALYSMMPPPDGPSSDAGTPGPVDAGTPAPVDAGTPGGTPDAGTPPSDGTSRLWVSGYYAGWFPDMYPADKIDFSSITHLMVGRGSVAADGTVSQALDANAANGVARAANLADRAHAAGRKAVLMLGGVGEGANFASAASPANRARFVQNLLAFLTTTHMDGVDLDWEESINFTDWLALCRDLRAARPGLIITLSIFPVNINVGLTTEARAFFGAVHPYVDQLNVMTYGIGMAGPWGGWKTWHTGALTGEGGDHPTSIASTLAAYAATGVPKAKLGMGIGFYGINYGPPNTGPLEQPQGAYQADDVEWRYSRIATYLAGHAANYRWDANAQMGYLSFPGGFSPGAGYSVAGFLSYEDERSIAAKGAWAKANGYGGTIIWVLNYGCTNPATGANPLLTATRQAFLQ